MAFDTVANQQKLKPRAAPYWRKIATGQYLGVRKSAEGMPLHWHARAYDPITLKQPRRALGEFAHLPANERFDAATEAAREWFKHLAQGGSTQVKTVQEACAWYVEHLHKASRVEQAIDAAKRFARYVNAEPIAKVQLPKLTKEHVKRWRVNMAMRPPLPPKRGKHCRNKNPLPAAMTPRTSSTVNRDMVALRAALNLAKEDGFITSDAAWSVVLRPIKDADRKRDLYLTPDQRRALLAKLTPDLAAFVRGLCLLPLRPGALAKLRVEHFNVLASTLMVPSDKAGAGRKLLLPGSATALLKEAARGKLPAAPLFCRWDGQPWNRDTWKDPIKAGVLAAGLPPAATAYTLRHSTITDLVTAGTDLFTVATLAGTSVVMIEKHYAHLQQERARDALAGLAL